MSAGAAGNLTVADVDKALTYMQNAGIVDEADVLDNVKHCVVPIMHRSRRAPAVCPPRSHQFAGFEQDPPLALGAGSGN